MTLSTEALYTAHLKVLSTLVVCPCGNEDGIGLCTHCDEKHNPDLTHLGIKRLGLCAECCLNCEGRGCLPVPKPYNGPTVETYGDTPQDAFREAESLLLTNNWASILVVALEERDYIPFPMQDLNMVFTHPDLD